MADRGTNKAFAAAVAAVEQNPASDDAWDALEGLAETNNAPDEVARAYREALDRGVSREAAPHVADRAVRFYQEWFVDSPEALPNLLGSIVDRYPDLDWAFERLVVLHTSAARWEELLSLYDRTLAATRDEKKRQRLLDDAARLAKDFAGEPDRAVDYLQQLLALDPSNDKLVVSLERLLERRERWNELLALWRDRIPQLDTEDARATRARIAAISLERLHEPQLALKELRELVEESPGHTDACAHLERILALEGAPLDARREALSLLRKTYEIVERPADVVRVLDLALSFVKGDDRRLLERECAARLGILGRDEEAIAHYAALLRQAADDTDARKQMRQLARRANRRDLQVQALIDAADAAAEEALRVPLWLEAADVLCDALKDSDRAIELYERVLGSHEVEQNDALAAAHALNSLLADGELDEPRLAVLERLSVLERSPSFRRQILREAARLAEKLGDRERALTSYGQILEGDPGDLEAISAVVSLLEQMERWDDLIVALQQRAEASASPHARRADRVRIAEIQSTILERPDRAIDTWLAIREELGEDSECLAALDRLMSQTKRWQELGELLKGAVLRERDATADRLDRLADVYRGKLDEPKEALPLYEQALELDPKDEGARAGMKALLESPEAAHRAAEALAHAYERTDEWRQLLDLLEIRLKQSGDKAVSAELLRKAAVLYEERSEDPPAALFALTRAVPLAPYRRDLRAELLRLGEVTGRWTDVAEAIAGAAAAVEDDADAAAELRRLEAKLQEQKLEDWASAFEALRYASVLMPGDIPTLRELARAAARAGRWPEAAHASVAAIGALGRFEPSLIVALEEAAAKLDVWGDLADCLSKAVREQEASLPPALASELYGKIADWYLDRCEYPKAAASVADRALELTPDDPEALKRLVRLQQLKPGPELAFTLMRLDKAADERFLDALRDAAVLALSDDNRERARAVLEGLYRKSTALWISGTKASGEVSAEEGSNWALEKLVENLLADHKRERAARLLFDGAALPVGPERAAELSLRSAELWVDLNQAIRAIDAFRVALDAKPDDLAVIRRLAELLEREEARTGSVSLRERELSLTGDVEDRLELRLAGARRAADLEKRSGRVETLLANLADQPGHGPSLEQLHTILDERGRYQELCQMLEQQGELLESSNPENAASLWSKAAHVAEKNLNDKKRAIADHERVVGLTQDNDSLDSLARLHLDAEAPQEAVRWLERRLTAAAPKERVAVLLKLARTYIKANREADAVATLQTAFAEAPQSAEVRQLLIRLLRSREESAALADVLATAVEHAADEATVLAYAREAADLYHDKLELPERSVSVLRRAVALAPGDKKLRAMLAEGLRARDELDEARTILTQLIEDYGRRGSKERAEAHLLLGGVLHAQGSHEEALAQLDTAAKMDADNLVILRELAEMARDSGQLERAEGALRTLLLTARRLQASGASELAVGTSEVLFELSSIAGARGQREQADELAESAIESLAENDTHAPRLQARLRARGDYELLVRLLDSRLEYTRSPYRRGQILGEKADVILEHLNRPGDAFKVRLAAIDVDPGSPLLHEGTRELAARLNALDAYIEHLENALKHARRGTDAIVRCELFLRLGEIHEMEKNDLDKASTFYAQAKETGVREVDVLRAQARVAVAQGDEIEHLRLLEALSDLGEDQSDTRADALYRMAEVQLANEESLEQGIEMLRKAITDHPRVERAAAILRRAAEQHPENDVLLDTYEQVARDGGDHAILLHCLELRAARPNATTAHVREAVSKARELGDFERS
ncbi:MAG TPA: tetratricopeptide repeat protein, partial [Polyangiaceae bacterium]|nr:tetratricopeptide repeat protein [Polyangiaceae bacterium]